MAVELIAAMLLTISLSTDGYWLAGRPGVIQAQWAAPEYAVDATLHWRLALDELQIAQGQAPMPSDEEAFSLTLSAPAVRTRTTLRWLYELHADDGRVLSRGEHALHIFPDDQLDGLTERQTHPVTVLAEQDAVLLSVLSEAGVAHRSARRAADLLMQPPRFILVDASWLSDATDAASRSHELLELARAGSHVMLFEQALVAELAGLPVQRRPAPATLRWDAEHALFRGFTEADLASWLSSPADVWTLRLPADQPGLELAYWPPETPDAPIQAVVLTRTVGRGRIVLWQLPLGPWHDDPRSQRLLVNALDYLATPPGPTPAPADRPTPPKAAESLQKFPGTTER